jgi:hypothetical protein
MDIKFKNRLNKIEPITKGWSEDEKYHVETVDGRHMLLRVTDISEFDNKKTEYSMMEQMHALGVPTPQPLEFGLCDDQDSGNICFGVADGAKRYFIKFAGALTERANISTEEAIERMKSAVPIYRDLEHPILPKLISQHGVNK